jgi:hypothetical protein
MIASNLPGSMDSIWRRASAFAVSRSPLWTCSEPQQDWPLVRRHLAAVCKEDVDRRAVHLREGDVLDASREDRDPVPDLARRLFKARQ